MNNSAFLGAISATIAIPVLALPVPVGGSEIFCAPGEKTERWDPATSTVNLQVYGVPCGTAMTSYRIANGYPAFDSCEPSGTNPDDDEYPVLQSAALAASAWKVDSPLNSGVSYSSLTLQLDPNNPISAGHPIQGDFLNTVSLQEAGIHVIFGGGFTLAYTAGCRSDTTGYLCDVDVILNAMGQVYDSSGQFLGPGYSFVEQNALWGQWFGTTTSDLGSGQAFANPVLGYADLQGVLTHEFGHVLGLGHSLVDSDMSPTSSSIPTMFFLAQAQSPWQQTIGVYDCCTHLQDIPADAAATPTAGLLGVSAKTLEWDDRVAVGTTYTTPEFQQSYGVITGSTSNISFPEPTMHVMAIGKTDPVGLRVGTLSHLDGTFTISGLPPGEYYVYAEGIDIDAEMNPDSGFFPTGTLPEFVFSCDPSFSYRIAEYYNNGDFLEKPMLANAITVQAGTVTSGIDIVMSGSFGKLSVRDRAQPTFDPSDRGVILAPFGSSDPQIEVRIKAPSTASVVAVFATHRVNAIYQGQVVQVPPSGPGWLTSMTNSNATYDSVFGEFVFQGVIPDSLALYNVFVQGVIFPGSGAPAELTNTVTVMVSTP